MIYIEMEMPEKCSECRFETQYEFCKAMPDNFCGYTKDEGKPEWCPLKEQEPVEPIPPTDESDLWKCGNCNHQLFRCTHQRYCEMCGREVKWE